MAEPKPLRIVKLEAANVKRLTAVEITPDGNLVVVGGKNGAGKSSVLDSIAFALGGKALVCEEPLRRGAEHGHVEVNLGDLTVRRTFTPTGGGTLTVSNAEGATYRSPQTILDRLVGALSFDPLAFARMAPREQREQLRELVGLDFSELDARRAEAFEERTGLNRQIKALEARLEALPEHPDAPAEPVVVAELVAELEAAELTSYAARQAEERHAAAVSTVSRAEGQLARLDDEIARLQSRRRVEAESLERMRGELDGLRVGAESKRAAVVDAAPIRDRIAAAEGVNAKVRENLAREAVDLELGDLTRQADERSDAIYAIDGEKAKALAEAKFPVEGLTFDDAGVRLNGVPFSQASSAEQLRVSVAMAAAANPRLRVALVRDGSLLDSDSLALLAKLAEQNELQVWLEVVRDDAAGCSVVIEEGAVKPPAESAT